MCLFKYLIVCGLSSSYLDTMFHRVGIFNFNQPYQVSFSRILSLVLYLKKSLALPKLTQIFCYIIFQAFHSFFFVCFILTSVIHFEFILVKGVRSVSRFNFVCVVIQFLQHHLCYLCSSVKNQLAAFMGIYSWPLYLVPLIQNCPVTSSRLF